MENIPVVIYLCSLHPTNISSRKQASASWSRLYLQLIHSAYVTHSWWIRQGKVGSAMQGLGSWRAKQSHAERGL